MKPEQKHVYKVDEVEAFGNTGPAFSPAAKQPEGNVPARKAQKMLQNPELLNSRQDEARNPKSKPVITKQTIEKQSPQLISHTKNKSILDLNTIQDHLIAANQKTK